MQKIQIERKNTVDRTRRIATALLFELFFIEQIHFDNTDSVETL